MVGYPDNLHAILDLGSHELLYGHVRDAAPPLPPTENLQEAMQKVPGLDLAQVLGTLGRQDFCHHVPDKLGVQQISYHLKQELRVVVDLARILHLSSLVLTGFGLHTLVVCFEGIKR